MTEQGLPAGDDRQAFRRNFRRLIEELLNDRNDEPHGETLRDVLTQHFGQSPSDLAVVSEQVPAHRMVDADIAVSELVGSDPDARLVGLAGDMRHHLTFGDLLHHGGIRLGQVDYAHLETGPRAEDRRQVVTSGVHLFSYDGKPIAIRILGANPQFGRETAALEVMAVERDTSDAAIERIRSLMDERSVIRGQVVTFGWDPYGRGMAGLSFLERPAVPAEAVILPEGELARVRHHVVGIGEARDRLRAAGQHLKRGVLLYGPPGTGKTHTVRHLLSATPGTTAVLLSGGALSQIHAAARVARAHQPALIVLEDVDLVAEDRSMGMENKPLLFEVLDALDGLDADADVAFLLTTNRVATLERALSQRPGRVDLAAEIPLPDEAGRLALLRLYAAGLFSDDALTAAAARAEGTTASFAKELVRRAVLRAALRDESASDEDLSAALDELLSDAEVLTRSLLGSGRSDAGQNDEFDGHMGQFGGPSGPVPGMYPGPSDGFFAYTPGADGAEPGAHSSEGAIEFDEPEGA